MRERDNRATFDILFCRSSLFWGIDVWNWLKFSNKKKHDGANCLSFFSGGGQKVLQYNFYWTNFLIGIYWPLELSVDLQSYILNARTENEIDCFCKNKPTPSIFTLCLSCSQYYFDRFRLEKIKSICFEHFLKDYNYVKTVNHGASKWRKHGTISSF